MIGILITLCSALKLKASIYSSVILHKTKLSSVTCFLTESSPETQMPQAITLGFHQKSLRVPAMSGLESKRIHGQSAIIRFSFLNLILGTWAWLNNDVLLIFEARHHLMKKILKLGALAPYLFLHWCSAKFTSYFNLRIQRTIVLSQSGSLMKFPASNTKW